MDSHNTPHTASYTEVDQYADDAINVLGIGAEDEQPLTELEKKEQALSAKRSEYARITAGRQRQFFDRTSEAYNDVKGEYTQLVQEYGRLKLEDELATLSEETDKNALVISYLVDEQNALRDEVNSDENMTTRVKFINKFAQFMNSGTRLQRIGKGIGVGLAAGVLGGAIGGGLAAAGVVAATRFTKMYAKKRSDGIGKLTDSEKAEIQQKTDYNERVTGESDYFLSAQKTLDTRMTSDVQREQSRKRKAVAYGLAGVALGSVAGAAIHGMDVWGDVKASAAEAMNLEEGTTGFAPNGDPINDPSTPEAESTAPPAAEPETPPSPQETGGDSAGSTDTHSSAEAGSATTETTQPAPNTPELKEFRYGYSDAPEPMLEKMTQDLTGKKLSGVESYKLLNALYDEMGSNVMEGVHLSEASPGDIRIDNAGGVAKLTPQAAEFIKNWRG